jgi:HB1, ASXL, restriction endonuclease HTH domain
MTDMPWREAVEKILDENAVAMHYSDIAEQIVERGLRDNVGATPAATVNSQISQSIKYDGTDSPFIRTDRGQYILRKYADIANSSPISADSQQVDFKDVNPKLSNGSFTPLECFGDAIEYFGEARRRCWESSKSALRTSTFQTKKASTFCMTGVMSSTWGELLSVRLAEDFMNTRSTVCRDAGTDSPSLDYSQ